MKNACAGLFVLGECVRACVRGDTCFVNKCAGGVPKGARASSTNRCFSFFLSKIGYKQVCVCVILLFVCLLVCLYQHRVKCAR